MVLHLLMMAYGYSPLFLTAILFIYLQTFNFLYGFGSGYLSFIWKF